MRYFIVSEEELNRALDLTHRCAIDDGIYVPLDELQYALKACESRPIPEWATHVTGNKLNTGPDVTTWEFEKINK